MQRNGHTVELGLWVWGCLDPEKLQGSINVVGTIWARGVKENTFCFFQTEICSHEEEMCMIKKWTILHQKCCKVRWRNALVDVSCRLLPLSTAVRRENASRETTKSEREVFKLPHPGCRLFTVKSSAVTPKISPPTPDWYSVQNKQRRVPTREPDSRATRLRRVKYIRIRKRKRTNAPVGNDCGGVACVFTARIQHCRTKWNACHQSVTRNFNSFNAAMHIRRNIGQ